MRALNGKEKLAQNQDKEQSDIWGKPKANIPESVIRSQNAWIVRSSWEILKCLYKELRQRKFQYFQIKEIYNLDTLYQAVIQHWCMQLLKEGLFKGYVTHENEEMQSPQGQINIQETLQRQTKIRGQLVCNYDELSDDVYMNHILKGTLQYIMCLDDVQDNIKKEVKKALAKFQHIQSVDILNLKWKNIKYNNNTLRYKNLIDLCHWMYTEKQFSKHNRLADNIRVYNLFKKGIVPIINHLFGEVDTVEEYKNNYQLKNEPAFELAMFKEQTFAVVQIKGLQLVYMVRLQNQQYYQKDFQIQQKKIQELYSNIRKYENNFKENAVGAVIQVNINPQEYNVDSMNIALIESHAIGEIAIDLWDRWNFIETRLRNPYNYFIQRKKIGSN